MKKQQHKRTPDSAPRRHPAAAEISKRWAEASAQLDAEELEAVHGGLTKSRWAGWVVEKG